MLLGDLLAATQQVEQRLLVPFLVLINVVGHRPVEADKVELLLRKFGVCLTGTERKRVLANVHRFVSRCWLVLLQPPQQVAPTRPDI